jgi:hypothetical protein
MFNVLVFNVQFFNLLIPFVMKKTSIVLTLLAGALVYCLPAQARDLATFEEGASEFLNAPTPSGENTLEVVDNPDKTGANATNKCLLEKRVANCEWTAGDRLFNSTDDSVLIDAANRYMHIMVYSPDATSGHILIKALSEDNMWGCEAYNARFDFSPGKWKDVVVDLSAFSFNAVYGLYFLSQDWSADAPERNFYYDEIVTNDDPMPRGLPPVLVATVLEGFETPESISEFSKDGSALADIEVVNNPESNAVNGSAKVLHGKTIATGGDWWAGARVTFAEPFVQITDATRFLHILLKTTLVKYRFVIFHQSGETYTEEIVPRAANTWFDQIVDLYSIGEGLQDKLIYGIRLVAMVDNDDNQGKDFYLDQIEVNATGGYIIDATLSAITVDGTAVSGFSPTTYSYTVTVPATTSSVAIGATLNNAHATLDNTNLGTKPLTGDVTTFTIKVIAENTLDSATYTLQVALEQVIPSAVLTSTVGKLSVYPNPVVDGQLTIENLQSLATTVEVYSIDGKLVRVYQVTGESATINVSTLPQGVYLVKAAGKVAKVVKQ